MRGPGRENDRRRSVVFIGAVDRPVTGGEKYDAAVIDCLRGERPVETVSFSHMPRVAQRSFLASNAWLVRRFWSRLASATFVEDYFWHPRTFLFNWVARSRGARFVSIVHHLYHPLLRSRWQRVADRIVGTVALAAAHRVIVNSRSTAREVAALGIPASRFVVVHPGVERVPPVPGPTPQRRDRPRPLRLLAVGTIHPRKGLEFLVRALHGVSFPFQLELVGDPDYDPAYRSQLEAVIRECRLQDHVILRGRLPPDELDGAYRRADVFVVPSLWEGFGMALLDALLFGLPVIGTRAGGIPELVEDGANGVLVPPADADALRAALELLARDTPLRMRMGGRSRERGLALARPWSEIGARVGAAVAELDA